MGNIQSTSGYARSDGVRGSRHEQRLDKPLSILLLSGSSPPLNLSLSLTTESAPNQGYAKNYVLCMAELGGLWKVSIG